MTHRIYHRVGGRRLGFAGQQAQDVVDRVNRSGMRLWFWLWGDFPSQIQTNYHNFTFILSQRPTPCPVTCFDGQDVQSSTRTPVDSSRSVTCQSTSQTSRWLAASFWWLPVQHVYGQTLLRLKRLRKSLLSFSQSPSLLNQHIQANSNKLVSGQACAPVPNHFGVA